MDKNENNPKPPSDQKQDKEKELNIEEVLKQYGSELVEQVISYVDEKFTSYDKQVDEKISANRGSETEADKPLVSSGQEQEENEELTLLKSRLEELNSRIQDQDKEKHQNSIKELVRKNVGGRKLNNPELSDDIVNVIINKLGYGYKSTDQGLLNEKGGKTLEEDLNNFFESALGMNFLAPVGKFGTGEKIKDGKPAGGQNSGKPTAVEAVMQAF